MNYAAMAAAIRKERIGERIEHIRALDHISEAAIGSGNYIRAFWAVNVWLVVWNDMTNLSYPRCNPTTTFKQGGVTSKAKPYLFTIPTPPHNPWND